MIFEGFVAPGYTSQSVNFDAQRTMNWISALGESGTSKGKAGLFPTPGLLSFINLPWFPIRGMWAGEGRLFVVAGTQLVEIFANATYFDWGFIGNDGKQAYMYSNGDQLGIVSDGKFWIEDGVNPPFAIQFSGGGPLLPARALTFLDGYFIIAGTGLDSKHLFASALLDGFTWDPLDVATKEGYPDNIATIFADHEELWVFGDLESTEVWRNNGSPDGFPFQRDPSAFIHYGCGAPNSVVRLDNGVAWLAGDVKRGGPIAVFAQGFQPQRVSTISVEQAWAAYPTTTDAIAYSYFERGHHFWVISFPSGDATWCYDASAGSWHERGFYDGSVFHRHRASTHAFVGIGEDTGLDAARHYVGDWQSGDVYLMSSDYFNDNGNPIVRIRTAPHLAKENMNIFHHFLELHIETGNGTLIPELRWSDDHGHTYNALRLPSTSLPTAFGSRVIWRRLGRSRDRVYEVTLSSAVKTAIVGAYIRVSPGDS